MKKQTIVHIVVGVFVGIMTALFLFAGLHYGIKPLFDDKTTNVGTPKATTSPSVPGTSSSTGKIFASDDNESIPTQINLSQNKFASNKTKKAVVTSRGIFADSVIINDQEYPLHTYRPLAAPNDPQAAQWWTTISKLDQAWNITPGTHKVLVAVIDTGFALGHEEFVSRWHTNSGEDGTTAQEGVSQLNCTDRTIALNQNCNLVDDDVDGIVDNEIGSIHYENPSQRNCTDRGLEKLKSCNRIDDDNNGYVDDIRGWDVINQDKSVQAGQLSPYGEGTDHGTMVAGVAAASGNNGVGIAGVNWNATILPIQALDDDGYGNTRSVGESIYYAINQKADVINISLGTDFEDPYVREAVEKAVSLGITIVAASGNDGCECITYPARYPEVIAVGATDTSGSRASFSSWGAELDIAAPGVAYTLPTWAAGNALSAYSSNVAGTSFSSPFVAGLVAAMKSHRPNASSLHLIAALHETADRSKLGPTEASNKYYGYGSVNALSGRQRLIDPRHYPMAYALSRVSIGNYFTATSTQEQRNSYIVQDCQVARPNMPLYELKHNSRPFFSLSEVESRFAVARGYTKSMFANVCLSQPHDTYGIVRSLNVFTEFRNIISKY